MVYTFSFALCTQNYIHPVSHKPIPKFTHVLNTYMCAQYYVLFETFDQRLVLMEPTCLQLSICDIQVEYRDFVEFLGYALLYTFLFFVQPPNNSIQTIIYHDIPILQAYLFEINARKQRYDNRGKIYIVLITYIEDLLINLKRLNNIEQSPFHVNISFNYVP